MRCGYDRRARFLRSTGLLRVFDLVMIRTKWCHIWRETVAGWLRFLVTVPKEPCNSSPVQSPSRVLLNRSLARDPWLVLLPVVIRPPQTDEIVAGACQHSVHPGEVQRTSM
jgi:hypothetical protein